jgi:hypothetical protein
MVWTHSAQLYALFRLKFGYKRYVNRRTLFHTGQNVIFTVMSSEESHPFLIRNQTRGFCRRQLRRSAGEGHRGYFGKEREMRTMRLFLLILFCFNAALAWADVAPSPRTYLGGPPPNKPVQGQLRAFRDGNLAVRTGVSIAGANVYVRIKNAVGAGEKGSGPQLPAQYIKRTKLQGAGSGAGARGPELLADVTGEFDMKCSEDLGWNRPIRRDKRGNERQLPPEGVYVEFPVAYNGESFPRPVQFAVQVDGEPTPASRVLHTTWRETDEIGENHTLSGFTWRLPPLKRGQKLRISVQYSLALPQKEGKANFLYSLRSGSYWDGPIGWEVVNITAEKGLRMEVLTPTALKPEKKADGSLTWRITKAKPTEDIRLIIHGPDD